jgi:2-dehydropantoate 2-reductase
VRIAILGAGSIGCFVGGSWMAAGCDVRLIGRARIGAEIATSGLSLSDQDGWRAEIASSRVDFSSDPASLSDADVIVLTVKSIATEAAAADIARHGRKGATVISLQNGVSNVATLERLLPDFGIVQAVVPYNVVRLSLGHWHRATWGDLIAARTPVTEALARAIGDRPGRLLLSDAMAGVAWGKLLLNLNNAVNALSGTTILEELKQRDFRRVLAAAMLETLDLLTAAGIEPGKISQVPPRLLPHVIGSPDFIFRHLFLRVQKIDPKASSSMADDLKAGRRTEVDHLNGEVVRLAASMGRKAPVNAAIVDLVKQAEAGVERKWTARALREHVLGASAIKRPFGY